MKLRKFVVSFLACSIALSLAVGLSGCGAQKQGPVKEGSIVVGASPSPHAQILEAVSEQCFLLLPEFQAFRYFIA